MTAKKLDIPFVFTESGTDTLATEHKLPSVMWSQEYQDEYLSMNFGVFDSYDFVQGELVWNFADFQTTEGDHAGKRQQERHFHPPAPIQGCGLRLQAPLGGTAGAL